MFSENEKISGRQLYRSIVVTLAGPTLLVCPRVACQYGSDGLFVYAVAAVLALVYVGIIMYCRKKADKRRTEKKGVPQSGWYIVLRSFVNILVISKLLLLAIGGLYLISDVVTGILLPETHVFMVLGIIALGLIYWNRGSIENSARAFELLMYWVVVPIVIVVALALPNVQAENLIPVMNTGVKEIFLAGVFLWFLFTPAELLIICREHYKNDVKTTIGIWKGLAALIIGNLVTYATILGIYGDRGINEGTPYPLLKVMQISGIPGDFLRRVDGFMSVFLVLSLFCGMVMVLDYMGICLWQIGDMWRNSDTKRVRKKCCCDNVIIMRQKYRKQRVYIKFLYRKILRFVCIHKKQIFSVVVISVMVITVAAARDIISIRKPATGLSEVYADKKVISSTQLEERAFVMSVIIGEDTVTLEIASDAKDAWQTQSEYVTLHCKTVEEAEALYKESGEKRLDFTHMKIIFIEDKIYGSEMAEDNLKYMYCQEKFAENILVCPLKGDLAGMASTAIEKGTAFAVEMERIMVNSGQDKDMELYKFFR